jgi:hypothetical protein
MKPTKDENIFIIFQAPAEIVYKDVKRDRIWQIIGTCNCCGECEIGKDDPNLVRTPNPLGTAWNCYSKEPNRLDEPVTPEFVQQAKYCVLSGSYIK